MKRRLKEIFQVVVKIVKIEYFKRALLMARQLVKNKAKNH